MFDGGGITVRELGALGAPRGVTEKEQIDLQPSSIGRLESGGASHKSPGQRQQRLQRRRDETQEPVLESATPVKPRQLQSLTEGGQTTGLHHLGIARSRILGVKVSQCPGAPIARLRKSVGDRWERPVRVEIRIRVGVGESSGQSREAGGVPAALLWAGALQQEGETAAGLERREVESARDQPVIQYAPVADGRKEKAPRARTEIP